MAGEQGDMLAKGGNVNSIVSELVSARPNHARITPERFVVGEAVVRRRADGNFALVVVVLP